MSDVELRRALLDAAETALVDGSVSSRPSFRPRFISNDYAQGKKVLSVLEEELLQCTGFCFSVAFVTMSGIAPLLQTFGELERRGVRGRILTTDYLAFSEPAALERLAAFSTIDVHMYRSGEGAGHPGFHAKGYLFSRPDMTVRALIGSSNLTGNALSVNKEWNLALSSTEKGELVLELAAEFDALWESSLPLDRYIDAYRVLHEEKRAMLRAQRVSSFEAVKLQPNAMQLAFVSNLDAVIESGERRALLISATGTGKTYASAFAVRHRKPARLLFLAHREQVLKQAMRSYRRVSGSSFSYGLISGGSRETDADYVFATMQMMAKDEVLRTFDPRAFDFIVVDEVHRAGSASYLKILSYFKPSFCLGMTASPDRPDGFDIYKLFDNNIVYEIRLQKALEENLLCPFHYFGITDLEIDGCRIDELSTFAQLTSDSRVDYLVEKAAFYGYSGDRVKGLVFCRNVSEAASLAASFCKRGLRACALSGADSQEYRENVVARLAARTGDAAYADRLDYVFTVDIFNEGIDIPEVNQVLMLRPTESPIVFVQQLGRGLRKADGKDYVVVIDFIGNYRSNYMIPMALSGDRTYNKDAIRKFVLEGDRVIPGCSTVHFDEISRERIFASIDSCSVDMRMMREAYRMLKHKLGRRPRMIDFYRHGEIDPLIIIEKRKSYYRFLEAVEPTCAGELSEDEHVAIEYASRFFANGMRPHELVALKALLEEGSLERHALATTLVEYWETSLDDRSFESTARVLGAAFANSAADKARYGDVELATLDGECLVRGDSLRSMKDHGAFASALADVVELGLARFEDSYSASPGAFSLYEKYTRKDACRLLDWPVDASSTVYGYRVAYGTCPIFVTYEKSDDISSSTRYADEFLSQELFSWMTRSRLTVDSPEVQSILNADSTGLEIHLFIKKSDSEGSDFYYFGRVHPIAHKQTTQCSDDGKKLPIVNITFELEHPVRDDVYAYFEGGIAHTRSSVA